MNDTKIRRRTRDLDVQLMFTQTEQIPPERLKDALRVLVTWFKRTTENANNAPGIDLIAVETDGFM